MMKKRYAMALKPLKKLPSSRSRHESCAPAERQTAQQPQAEGVVKNSLQPTHHPLRLMACVTFLSSLLLLPSTIHAQTEPQREATPFMAWDPPDEELIDAFIPVITFEQLGDSRNNLPSYRIQIFNDGRAIYHGFKDVRQPGEVRFNITRAQVLKIQSKFTEYKFWQAPANQYNRRSGQAWLFVMRKEGQTKSMRTAGSDYGLLLLSAIEDETRSDKWRCPYIDIFGDNKCLYPSEAMSQKLDWFAKRQLPQLLESFK